jgi:hypothetical protein
VLAAGTLSAVIGVAGAAGDWRAEWPRTDFGKYTVPLSEIESGGPPKDGIPAIDRPRFVNPKDAARWLDPREPVIVFEHRGDARAYPLQILMFHEIVNDVVAGTPVAVTFCPLCNASIVFDRRVDGTLLDFGTTGKLRKSDLVNVRPPDRKLVAAVHRTGHRGSLCRSCAPSIALAYCVVRGLS